MRLCCSFVVLLAVASAASAQELVVWSGEKPAGQTWVKLGPKGTFAVADKTGGGGKCLRLHMDGSGWRGGGINWKGWFPPESGDDATRFTALVFQIRQITKVADADLSVALVDNVKRPDSTVASNSLSIVADGGVAKIDGQWRRVVLPLDRFAANKPLQLGRLWGVDFSNVGDKELTFEIDRIGFAVEKSATPRFAPGPAYSATGSVDPEKVLYPIDQRIYGVCGLAKEKLAEYRVRMVRWGGNPSSRFNWKLGFDNAGSDWFFKNRGSGVAETGYLDAVLANRSVDASTYLTVPMVGWVAKDGASYGFAVSKYGKQKAAEPGQPDVGNGVKPDGSNVTGNDPRDTSVSAPPEFIAEGVRFVVQRAGRASNGGVAYWVLDNEPMLWNSTHRDVHPEPPGYDELWDRTVKYAEAIRAEDPTAKLAGFCNWGWTDLYYSAKDAGTDRYRTRPDFHAHGKVPLAEWFIQKCGEYRKQHGRPLVDVFDTHWYPQGPLKGPTAYVGRGRDPELNAYRLRSTRDLWDHSYEQESWVRRTDTYSPVALIPRIRDWIDGHNPGMEIAVGEYNFGGSDNITGGLAQAEAFGVFARERVDLAFLWHTPEGTQELAWQLFRSYDGRRHGFGDKLLPAESSHRDLALYAAKRSDGAVTIVAINKNLHGPCELALDLGSLKGDLHVWRFDQDHTDRVAEVPAAAGPVNTKLALTLPAASASMLVVTPRK